MSKPFQLQIPSPCQEQWSNMQPAERGRHCSACQKTVIDFTTMSDPEIIRYLSIAGPQVCGRLAPDQLHRTLVPLPPPQKNGWAGWKWLLAGFLLTFDKPTPQRPAQPVSHQSSAPPQEDNIPTIDTISDQGLKTDCVIGAPISDSYFGMISRAPVDSTRESEQLPQDTAFIPKMDSASEDLPYTGQVERSEVSQTITLDSIKSFITDTLTALRLLPAKGMRVYPNPVQRGSIFHISWQAELGNYQVALYNLAGALIQIRTMQVSSPSQVDDWQVPSQISEGIYILRASRTGQVASYSRKVIVE